MLTTRGLQVTEKDLTKLQDLQTAADEYRAAAQTGPAYTEFFKLRAAQRYFERPFKPVKKQGQKATKNEIKAFLTG